jgi:ubiquinone/menaquinone biosynthesis C-methylase UbiE
MPEIEREWSRDDYRSRLEVMEKVMRENLTNSLSEWAVITTLVWLILRWELHLVDRNLSEHPYKLAAELINDCVDNYVKWLPVTFASDTSQWAKKQTAPTSIEVHHQNLFQALWTQFDHTEYLGRIDRYVKRLELNDLGTNFWAKKSVLDLGCGHGNFAIAISKFHPRSVTGVDFGEDSVLYAQDAARRLKVANVDFEVQNVHALTFPDETFDVVIQNGVFHHLAEEDSAYREAVRVLKKGGYFWIYTDGKDHIFGDIQDTASRILSDVPSESVIGILANMGLSQGKQYHLGDSLKATYRHWSFEELCSYLATFGLELVRRLEGGYETDFDASVIKGDIWGEEKFGSGDLRLLVRKCR